MKTVPAKYTAEVAPYLRRLRDSGAVNMWGAAPYLAKALKMSEEDANGCLIHWIETPADHQEPTP